MDFESMVVLAVIDEEMSSRQIREAVYGFYDNPPSNIQIAATISNLEGAKLIRRVSSTTFVRTTSGTEALDQFRIGIERFRNRFKATEQQG